MLGFGDLWKVIEFLTDKINAYKCIEREQLKKYFEVAVEPSYQDLERIHNDYTVQLSKLRMYVRDMALPPQELIDWLRQTGLEYRPKRDALSTFEAEITGFGNMPADPTSDDAQARFLWHLQQYAKGIVAYIKCTTSHKDLSYYRDYEFDLTRLLRLIEDEHRNQGEKKILASIFYETDYVKDLHEELINVCDKVLPLHWKRVTEQYRALRSCVLRS